MNKVAWVFWAVVALPFVIGSLFATANAETGAIYYDKNYAKQAIADIATIEAAYDAVRLYYDGDEPQADAKAGHGDLENLVERLEAKPAPLQATGIQEQIIFAAKRCQNYAAKIGWLTAEEKSNVFVAIAEIQLREYCAVQIHATKMRLIDYGVVNRVNPYE